MDNIDSVLQTRKLSLREMGIIPKCIWVHFHHILVGSLLWATLSIGYWSEEYRNTLINPIISPLLLVHCSLS